MPLAATRARAQLVWSKPTAIISASEEGHAEIVDALLAADGIDANLATAPAGGLGNRTALHVACKNLRGAARVEMAGLLLLLGGCRFRLDGGGSTPLALAGGDTGVLKVFASGVDYWRRTRHGGHARALREAVVALLLVRQRLGHQAAAPAHGRVLRSRSAALAHALPHLPEEIWLAACVFLRGADFMPSAGTAVRVV